MVALITPSILGIDFMNDPELYHPACLKKDDAFNSTKTFTDNSKEVTREAREAANALTDALIQSVRESIANG